MAEGGTDPAIYIGIATIIAVLAGPISAVFVTRLMDNHRARRERRMHVFRTLMGTRRLRLNPEHVGALNLVEIEFHKDQNIIQAWKAYLASLNHRLAADASKQEVDSHFVSQDTLLAKLLHAMGESLGFEIEQLDIYRGGYSPQGWENDESQQRMLRFLLIDLLQRNRTLPVTMMAPQAPGNPFPPPPEQALLTD